MELKMFNNAKELAKYFFDKKIIDYNIILDYVKDKFIDNVVEKQYSKTRKTVIIYIAKLKKVYNYKDKIPVIDIAQKTSKEERDYYLYNMEKKECETCSGKGCARCCWRGWLPVNQPLKSSEYYDSI